MRFRFAAVVMLLLIAALPARTDEVRALTRQQASEHRDRLWKAHVVQITKDRAAEIQNKKLVDGKLEMPFSLTKFGEKPGNGHSLWISMHGGGNASSRVNDRQWENQKKLYKLDEGIYIAPRAPTNSWNLWHEPHIDRLFGRLIENLIALEHVDPNRVYIMGYSAGGDGVYQLAPRMADRWAAAGMMAGHPNDVTPLGLRNVPFALQMGGKDSAYNRNKVAAEWEKKLGELRRDDPGGYEHFVNIYETKSHWMDREDAQALPWMAKHTRNPTPERIVWKQSGTPHERFYWLAIPPDTAKPGALVIAKRTGQTVEIEKADGVSRLIVRLDDRFIDLDKPITISYEGRTLFDGIVPRSVATLEKTLAGRGDPNLMFAAEVQVKLSE